MTSFRYSLSIALLALSAMIAGCGGGGGAAPAVVQPGMIRSRADINGPGAWTVLVYLDADNDLETAGIRNFNQMEMVGSNEDVRIVVQMDRHPARDATNGDWSDTRRYLITQDTDSTTMRSIRLDETPLGEKDMGDWQTLRDFVEWGVREFPSTHYCLVIWDHGTGWEIRSFDSGPTHKYIAVDDTDSGGMNITDIPLALANVDLDVLAFDACLMQQLETAYELKDSTRYMIASPAPEPTPGYNYSAWLRRIDANTSVESLCRTIVEEYGRAYPPGCNGITQSVLDMSKIDALADAVDTFAGVLLSSASADSLALRSARTSSLNYSILVGSSQRYSYDLLDYATRSAAVIGPSADSALTALRSALSDAVLTELHNPDTPNAHGLAIYLPPPSLFDGNYRQLELASRTRWDDWIAAQQR